WFENVAGNGTVWTLHTIGTPDGAESVFPADIDRDGDVDAVGASFNSGTITWFENAAGNGSTWLSHTIGAAIGADFVVAAGVHHGGRPGRVRTSVYRGTVHCD